MRILLQKSFQPIERIEPNLRFFAHFWEFSYISYVNLGLKEGISIDADSGTLGMYFDAVVVEVKTFLLLFRLALAILWARVIIKI